MTKKGTDPMASSNISKSVAIRSAQPPVARRTGGFTLVEILLALGIFAIGMAAVASLFPVAAILQRETATDTFASYASGSAEAVMKNRAITYGTGGDSSDLGTRYHTSSPSSKTTVEPIADLFWAAQRAYPTAELTGVAFSDVSECDYFWVPFIQDLSGDDANPNWSVRIFVMRGDSKADYTINTGGGVTKIANATDSNRFPKVVATSCSFSSSNANALTLGTSNHGLQSGDKVMDNNGTTYTVSLVDGDFVTMNSPILRTPSPPSELWYAPPLGGVNGSPTKAIITVGDLNITTP